MLSRVSVYNLFKYDKRSATNKWKKKKRRKQQQEQNTTQHLSIICICDMESCYQFNTPKQSSMIHQQIQQQQEQLLCLEGNA